MQVRCFASFCASFLFSFIIPHRKVLSLLCFWQKYPGTFLVTLHLKNRVLCSHFIIKNEMPFVHITNAYQDEVLPFPHSLIMLLLSMVKMSKKNNWCWQEWLEMWLATGTWLALFDGQTAISYMNSRTILLSKCNIKPLRARCKVSRLIFATKFKRLLSPK